MIEHVRKLQDAVAASGPAMEVAQHWGRLLADVLPAGGRLLVAGNGGSAAEAQHLAAELVGRYSPDRPPFSAIALNTDSSAVTAIANDFGADEIFARQVCAHGRWGDVCLLMSTSGRSPNLLAAAKAAARCGLQVWAMTGRTPNPLADLAHQVLAVDAADTCTIQEVHLIALHVVCEEFDTVLGYNGADARRSRSAVLAGRP